MILGPTEKIEFLLKLEKMPIDAQQEILDLIKEAQLNTKHQDDLNNIFMGPHLLNAALNNEWLQIAELVLDYQQQQKEKNLEKLKVLKEKTLSTKQEKIQTTQPKKVIFPQKF